MTNIVLWEKRTKNILWSVPPPLFRQTPPTGTMVGELSELKESLPSPSSAYFPAYPPSWQDKASGYSPFLPTIRIYIDQEGEFRESLEGARRKWVSNCVRLHPSGFCQSGGYENIGVPGSLRQYRKQCPAKQKKAMSGRGPDTAFLFILRAFNVCP